MKTHQPTNDGIVSRLPRLIGITGLAGAGKSTAAKEIARVTRNATILQFSEPLKALATTLGWTGGKSDRDRRFFQILGDACREYSDTGLVDACMYRAGHRMGQYVIIDDVRKDDEARAILERRGIMFRVLNPRCTSGGHNTETPISSDLCNYTLTNDGTLKEYESHVRDTMQGILDNRKDVA